MAMRQPDDLADRVKAVKDLLAVFKVERLVEWPRTFLDPSFLGARCSGARPRPWIGFNCARTLAQPRELS